MCKMCKIIKNLCKNIGKIFGIWARQGVLRFDTKAKPIKGKIDKVDIIKTENFCSSKDPIKRLKK